MIDSYADSLALAGARRCPSATPVIERWEQLDPDTFRDRFFQPKRPVVITGMATKWPAIRKWSFPYFADLADDRMVTLERGNVLQGATDFETRGLRNYIDELLNSSKDKVEAGGRTYLSLFKIFAHFPELRQDVDFSLITRLTRWHYVFGWLGPAGTVTGYHIDWIDNILAQISGRKRLWLVPPEQSRFMYPSVKYDFRSTLSALDPDGWDRDRYPLFERVTPVCVTLEPGQMLFIPRGWWHRVQSLDPSISVNTFGHDIAGILIHQSRAKLLDGLHRLGLFGGTACTCHQHLGAAKPEWGEAR